MLPPELLVVSVFSGLVFAEAFRVFDLVGAGRRSGTAK